MANHPLEPNAPGAGGNRTGTIRSGPLARVAHALSRVGKAFQAADRPLAVDGETFRRAARRLADLTAEAFGADARAPLAALHVDHCAAAIKYQNMAENTLDLVNCLQTLVVELRRETESRPAGRAWYTDRELRNLTGALFEFCGAAPDSEWTCLPEQIDHIGWVKRAKRQLSADLRRAGCDRACLARREEGLLADAVEELRPALEYRARELWMATRCKPDAEVEDVYAQAWTDLLAPAQVSPADVHRAAQRCGRAAQRFQLGELAEFFDPLDRLLQYALQYLVPPAPLFWRLESASRVGQYLDGQVSRWYFRPFHHEVRPLELIPPVLRAGRPLYYDRPGAHALLQYQIVLDRLAPSRVYFDILGRFERNFSLLMEGYLLRLAWLPRLKNAVAWAAYLDELLHLHSGSAASGSLWQEGYAAERGITSAEQVLLGAADAGSVQ